MGGGGESDPDSGDDQQQQQQEQQQTTQQMIQALMQMMQTVGMQEGEGSTGFGDPGRADHTGPGMRNRAGEDTEARGTAMDPSRWPSSYRNMMDAYYQAMEE